MEKSRHHAATAAAGIVGLESATRANHKLSILFAVLCPRSFFSAPPWPQTQTPNWSPTAPLPENAESLQGKVERFFKPGVRSFLLVPQAPDAGEQAMPLSPASSRGSLPATLLRGVEARRQRSAEPIQT
eukprot:5288852-Pyramimonas_sp.AAC.1